MESTCGMCMTVVVMRADDGCALDRGLWGSGDARPPIGHASTSIDSHRAERQRVCMSQKERPAAFCRGVSFAALALFHLLRCALSRTDDKLAGGGGAQKTDRSDHWMECLVGEGKSVAKCICIHTYLFSFLSPCIVTYFIAYRTCIATTKCFRMSYRRPLTSAGNAQRPLTGRKKKAIDHEVGFSFLIRKECIRGERPGAVC